MTSVTRQFNEENNIWLCLEEQSELELKLEKEPNLQLRKLTGLQQYVAHIGHNMSLPQDFADLIS